MLAQHPRRSKAVHNGSIGLDRFESAEPMRFLFPEKIAKKVVAIVARRTQETLPDGGLSQPGAVRPFILRARKLAVYGGLPQVDVSNNGAV